MSEDVYLIIKAKLMYVLYIIVNRQASLSTVSALPCQRVSLLYTLIGTSLQVFLTLNNVLAVA